MTTTDICCIFNYPSHYREHIYRLMEKELNCDFFFGDIEKGNIQAMNYSHLQKPVKDLKTIKFGGGFNWIKGSVSLMFQSYRKYIFAGEPYCLSTWVCLVLAKLLGKETYLWTHGWYGDETPTKAFIKKIFFKLASDIFLYGEYAKNLMIQSGFKAEKLHVVFNSLDYDTQSQIRHHLATTNIYEKHFGNNDPVLIFTGRLTKVKKLDQLIEAHHRLNEKGVRFNVILLGEGPEKEFLNFLVEQAKLSSRYWFYGACYDESTIGELYYNAALCVSPGNVGLTGIHSLMYGCPVVTHSYFAEQMPEFEAIRPNQTGVFFEYDNIDSLAKTIESWLQKHFPKKDELRKDCYRVIDDKFNPYYQIKIIKSVLNSHQEINPWVTPQVEAIPIIPEK